jgi:ribonuclease P protein component
MPSPAQVVFSVPKMGFRHAVVRNLIKRRMREAYRRKKVFLYEFLTGRNICVAMIIIFRNTSVPDYRSVEKSIDETLKKLTLMITDKEK